MIKAREHERVGGSLYLLLEPREKEESNRCGLRGKKDPESKRLCITSTQVLTFSEVRKDSSECENQVQKKLVREGLGFGMTSIFKGMS